MYEELRDEFTSVFGEDSVGYWYDLVTHEVFRVDESTATLTEDEALQYPHLVEEADHKEVAQFIHYKVFRCTHRKDLEEKPNIVDCIWVRKWKVYLKSIKSRM